MSKISVYDIKGNVVADTELNDAIWGVEPNVTAMHTMVVNPDPHRGFGRRQKALEAEGHRPRKAGLYPRSAVDPRRRSTRT